MPPPRPALPSSRSFVTDVLRAIAADAPSDLAHAPDATRKLIVALHVLFPEQVLPALDLLDRGLVTRFIVTDGTGSATETTYAIPAPAEPPHTLPTDTHPPVFYVRSAQPRRSRFASSVDSRATYQVRLSAWNCTCPAFAFAAFPAETEAEAGVENEHRGEAEDEGGSIAMSRQTDAQDDHEQVNADEAMDAPRTPQAPLQSWAFGGLPHPLPSPSPALAPPARIHAQRMPPTCKHLLACALAEQCGGAFKCVEQRVSVEEAAGWAAGWGDC